MGRTGRQLRLIAASVEIACRGRRGSMGRCTLARCNARFRAGTYRRSAVRDRRSASPDRDQADDPALGSVTPSATQGRRGHRTTGGGPARTWQAARVRLQGESPHDHGKQYVSTATPDVSPASIRTGPPSRGHGSRGRLGAEPGESLGNHGRPTRWWRAVFVTARDHKDGPRHPPAGGDTGRPDRSCLSPALHSVRNGRLRTRTARATERT